MIRIRNLSVRIGSFSLKDVSFEIPTGAYGILMGQTGAGKTTLLEAICGLKPVIQGSIELMGQVVTRLKPAERGIGFVPQEGALFTTMTVRDQIGFSLWIRKWSRRDIDNRVMELAELLRVSHLLDRKPQGLSGGERQRVALGRALAARPGVLCLDEPLSALDDATREEMYQLLKSVQTRTGVTTLHITHSRVEARRLADMIFQLEQGDVRQVASASPTDKREAESRPRATPASPRDEEIRATRR